MPTLSPLKNIALRTFNHHGSKPFDAQAIVAELETIAHSAARWEIALGPSMSQMPAGHNGPYLDVETPVRNTAHWLTFYSILYGVTARRTYKTLADRLFGYLQSPGFARNGAAYTHRQKPGKDWCNGVIGAAWVIEALVRYAQYGGCRDARDLARQIAAACPFDSGQAAWQRLDPVKGATTIDATYNHQAWLAAAIAEVDPSLAERASLFLDRSIEGAFRIRENGRIDHLMYLRGAINRAAQVKHALQSARNRRKVGEKEDGYHLFVLFALARLKQVLPGHPFFSHEAFRRSLRYVAEPAFLEKLSGSSFAYPYNAPGFELPLIVAVFASVEPSLGTVDCSAVHDAQKKRTFSDEVGLYVNGCPDPCTLAARVYELAMGIEAVMLRNQVTG